MNDFSDLKQACVQMHEYYTELRAAGFTEHQALYIVATVASGGPTPPQEGGTHE